MSSALKNVALKAVDFWWFRPIVQKSSKFPKYLRKRGRSVKMAEEGRPEADNRSRRGGATAELAV
jgi:hypothetical protein